MVASGCAFGPAARSRDSGDPSESDNDNGADGFDSDDSSASDADADYGSDSGDSSESESNDCASKGCDGGRHRRAPGKPHAGGKKEFGRKSPVTPGSKAKNKDSAETETYSVAIRLLKKGRKAGALSPSELKRLRKVLAADS